MELKLAGADFSFPLLSHNNVLTLISMIGFEGVDIGLFEGRSHLQPSTEFADTEKNARALSKKLKDRNLKPADVFLQTAVDFESLASNHPDRAIRNRVREIFMHTLEYTAQCEGTHVSGLPGVFFDCESRQDSYSRCCEELAWRVEKALEYGIVFSIEPHLGSVAATPADAKKMVADVSGLTLTLDYTHFTKIGIPDNEIEPLIQYASHFHARGAAKGFLQASYKNNTICYESVLQEMKRIHYDGFIGIEYVWTEWEHCNEVDNLSEIIQLRDFLLRESLRP